MRLGSFLRDTKGLETVEYAIIMGLLIAASVAIIAAIGLWVTKIFANTQKEMGA